MGVVLGGDCRAYVNRGTPESPDMTEAIGLTGANIDGSAATADVSRRGTGGYRAKVATLKEGSVTFEVIYDTDDSGAFSPIDFFNELDAAYRDSTTIEMWFPAGELTNTTDSDGLRGFRAAFAVTDFSEAQELEDAVRFSITLDVSGVTPTPGYYVKGGGATPTFALVTTPSS